MTKTIPIEDVRVTVSGSAEAGWIIDIHDGTNWGVYHPDAADADAAKAAALADHGKAFDVVIEEAKPAPAETAA